MKSLNLVAVLSILLLAAGTAWAIPPDSGEGSFFFDGCDPDFFPLYDCGDFYICEAGQLDYRWKLFYYNNGDPKKYTEKIKFDGFVYEYDNPDNFIPYNPLSYTYTYWYVANEYSFHGLFGMITVPGYGQIFRDVGNIRFDAATGDIVFEAGDHEFWNEEFEAVCQFLANGD